jgi:hypothetical protein
MGNFFRNKWLDIKLRNSEQKYYINQRYTIEKFRKMFITIKCEQVSQVAKAPKLGGAEERSTVNTNTLL